jgi:hypothetical protein
VPAPRKQLSINLDPDVKRRLRAEAKSQRMSMASVVNGLLRTAWGLSPAPKGGVRSWTPQTPQRQQGRPRA